MNKVLFLGQLIPELSIFRYLEIIIRSKITWADHFNFTLRKAWEALHLIKCTFKWEIIIRNVLLLRH